MSKTFLKVSLTDIELFRNSKYDKNDIVCIVFLNGNCIDKLYFKYKDYQSNLPLANIIEKIQLIFQAKDTGELIGSISFSSDIFMPFKGKAFAQWFTLFDSTEDDEFDGYIGEHDEDCPRALISFRVEPAIGSVSQMGSASANLQFAESDLLNNLASSLNRTDKQKNLYGADEREVRGDVGPDSRINPRKGDNMSLTYNGTSISQDLQKNRKKQQGTNEGNDQVQGDDEIHVTNLDGKITDLLSMLQNQEKGDISSRNGNQKKDENSLNMNDFEENRELLELEMKKSAMLEETLKNAEVQLSKHEKLYEELEAKSQAQYKQLLEKNKALNDENYNLKQKIGNLEGEADKNKTEYANEIEKISQEYQNQTALDKSTIEKHTMTIENLERLNNDLTSQLEHAKTSLNHEKELIKQLQQQLEENLINNKGNLTGLKDKLQGYFDQIQAITEEKSDLEVKNSNAELKIQALEIKNTALEAQYESSKRDLEKVLQEVQEYKELTNNLKQTIESTANKKDEEILLAREAALDLEEQNRRLQSQNEFITAEKNELSDELANLRQMSYEGRISSLEMALENSEEARKNLQAQLQKSETRMQVFLQQQKEKSLVSKVYEDTIQELRDKNKSLSGNVENLTNQLDQTKYESTELRLKLDEHGEISEQNLRLREKLEGSKDENYKLKDTVAVLRRELFNTSTELIRQTNTALEQGNIIKELTQQMQALDNSLRIAFGDIKRMHLTLEAARKSGKSYEPYIPRYSDEVDQKLSEFCNRAELPVKFIRMKPGVYGFGSRKVRIECNNGRLFVQVGDDKIPIEEFVRLYAQNELFKIKNTQIEGNDTVDPVSQESNKHLRENTKEQRKQVQFENDDVVENWNSSSFSPVKGGGKKRLRKDRSSRQTKPLVTGEDVLESAQRSPVKNEDVEQQQIKLEEAATY